VPILARASLLPVRFIHGFLNSNSHLAKSLLLPVNMLFADYLATAGLPLNFDLGAVDVFRSGGR
jgi:hypothetical protein